MRSWIDVPSLLTILCIHDPAMVRGDPLFGYRPHPDFTDNPKLPKRLAVDPIPVADNGERVMYRIHMEQQDTYPSVDSDGRPLNEMKAMGWGCDLEAADG